MLAPAKPVDEAARQAGVEALHIVGTAREERFDRLVRLAAQVLDCPLAAVSFIDGDREWFKAVHGFAATELPRDASLAAHAILDSGPFVIPVLRDDERYADHPLASRPGIACYAAVPLRGPSGGNVGVLAVMDRKARRFTAETVRALEEIGHLAEDELEVHQHHMRRPGTSDTAPLRALLHAMDRPAAVLDDEGRIGFLNDAWAEAGAPGCLIDPADRVGTDMIARLQGMQGFQRKEAQRLARAMDEMIAGARDAVDIDHEIEGVPWCLEARRTDGAVILVHKARREEAARAAAEAALVAAALRAEEWAAWDRFRRRRVAALEQEINTPMTPVRLQLPLLLTDRLGELNGRQRNAVESLVRNVGRWHDRTQELLGVQREPRHASVMQDMDLRAVARDATALCRPAALQAGIKLHAPLDGAPVLVRGDPELMRQVITDLVEHALDHTGAGGRIDVDVDGDDGGGEVSVRDTAGGDTAQGLATLFDVDARRAAEPGGLRLPRCRQVVARMGGSCQAFGDRQGRRLIVHLDAA